MYFLERMTDRPDPFRDRVIYAHAAVRLAKELLPETIKPFQPQEEYLKQVNQLQTCYNVMKGLEVMLAELVGMRERMKTV